MIKRSNGIAAISVATLLFLAACSGTANINVPNATINASAQDAFNISDSSLDLQSVVGNDATAYRATLDETSTNNWILYYYSPSKQKSYRCVERQDTKKITEITEVVDVNLQFKADYKIEKTKIKVNVTQAKEKAVQAAANANANVSVGGTGATVGAGATAGATGSTGGGGATGATATASAFTKTEVISPKECKDQTGKDVSSPVYVVASATVSVKVYVNAETGEVVATASATASSSTTTPASTAPAATPTPAATATPTPMPSTTVDTTASGSATATGTVQ